jgi:hypothetical protein
MSCAVRSFDVMWSKSYTFCVYGRKAVFVTRCLTLQIIQIILLFWGEKGKRLDGHFTTAFS